jgi:hypothetical protein
MEITPLGQCNQFFRDGPYGLGLCLGRFYLFMLKQRSNHVSQQGSSMTRIPA